MIAKCEGECGKERPLHKSKKSGQMLCAPCQRAKFHKGICSRCGEFLPIYGAEDSKPVCSACWRRFVYNKRRHRRKCSSCGKIRVPTVGGKNPLCQPCYRSVGQKKETCSFCKQPEPVECYIAPDKPVCKNCYMRHVYAPPGQKPKICGKQGHVKVMVGGRYQFCVTCHHMRRFRKRDKEAALAAAAAQPAG